MRRRPWGAHLAAIGALCLLATVSFATPHDDSAHRSGLPVTLTLVDGRQRPALLQGVGCNEAMCSRVRAQDSHADSVWLDGLASVRPMTHHASGPVRAVLVFKDGTIREAAIIESNRVLYLADRSGRQRTLDLASLNQIDFN